MGHRVARKLRRSRFLSVAKERGDTCSTAPTHGSQQSKYHERPPPVLTWPGYTLTLLAHAQASVPGVSPLVSALSFSWLPNAALLFLRCSPLLWAYVTMPILDYILGEEEEPALKVSPATWYQPLYRFVSWAFVVLYAATLLGSAFVVTQPACSPLLFVLLMLNVGTTGGFAFTVAHELVHSRHSFDRRCADVLLTLVCYKQWSLSHIAHHTQVATPDDPASARYKESVRAASRCSLVTLCPRAAMCVCCRAESACSWCSAAVSWCNNVWVVQVYPFVLRSIKGEWADALRLEWQRVSRMQPKASKLQRLAASKCAPSAAFPACLLLSTSVAVSCELIRVVHRNMTRRWQHLFNNSVLTPSCRSAQIRADLRFIETSPDFMQDTRLVSVAGCHRSYVRGEPFQFGLASHLIEFLCWSSPQVFTSAMPDIAVQD